MNITSEQIQEFKTQLLAEKAEIESQLEKIAHKTGHGDDWEAIPDAEMKADGFRADKQENADETEEFEGRIATLNALEPRLMDVIHALDKIENNPEKFGTDETTGEPIPMDRMTANPAARGNV
ncbi:MAG: hypothetical protein OEX08_01765 [Candidatus Nomurabacteria bacterium]|nr:hypothetical protein [Candidatus Nomurabacteria bacterium]